MVFYFTFHNCLTLFYPAVCNLKWVVHPKSFILKVIYPPSSRQASRQN